MAIEVEVAVEVAGQGNVDEHVVAAEREKVDETEEEVSVGVGTSHHGH